MNENQDLKNAKKQKETHSSHSPKRRYSNFEKLSEDERKSAAEMDSVVGQSKNVQCAYTLFFQPTSLQLYILGTHDAFGAAKFLNTVKSATPKLLYKKLLRFVVTDNGSEFSDEDTLSKILEEDLTEGVSLYYCNPRHAEQKPHCEKNHSEGRQILTKGKFNFDELTNQDMRVLMSHVNSNPRRSLGGLSPIQAFLAIYGDEGAELLDAFGIEQIEADELTLTPEILNIERKKRGEKLLSYIK